MSRRGVSLVLLLALLGCDRAPSEAARCEPASSATLEVRVDERLLAFLSRARAAHHAADLAEGAGDRAGAIRALEAVTRGARPSSSPEMAEVLADVHARLGELRSEQGDYEGAAREVGEGLPLVPGTSYFRGHLFEVRGRIEERRMEAARARGDEAGAAAARAEALASFDEAMRLQDAVIRATPEPAAPAATDR
jgi:hypothetical protein